MFSQMKKAKTMMLAVVASALCLSLGSCGIDDKAEEAGPRLKVDTAVVNVVKNGLLESGETPSLIITANKGYEITSDSPWLTVDCPTGFGYKIVSVIAEENKTEAVREGHLLIKSFNLAETVTVKQSLKEPVIETNRTFYSEDFSWAIALGYCDPVGTDNAVTKPREHIDFDKIAPLWAETGLTPYDPTKELPIVCLHYILFNNNGNFDNGIILPKLNITGGPADATVSWVACPDGGGQGDRVPMVVEIVSGPGSIDGADGQVSEAQTIERPRPSPFVWTPFSFTLRGITSETRIAIRSRGLLPDGTWDSNQPNKYCRYFLDNILVKETTEE